MLVQQFFVNGLAHSSYLLEGSGSCAIVDPQRDVDVYIAAAADLELKITHILETHRPGIRADQCPGFPQHPRAGSAETAH